jgi:hypothetical protein
VVARSKVNKQFHSQKVWEKKIEIYQQLLGDMSQLYEYYSDNFDNQVQRLSSREFRGDIKASIQALERHAHAGGFIISITAGNAVRDVVIKINSHSYNSVEEDLDEKSEH